MPFQYTPYRNQYVGSIADLMGRGRDAEAQALIDSANAQAQAAQISGQAWGGAIQGIGNTVAQGITDWNSPEARRQRAMDDARKVYELGTADTRPAMVEDVIGKRDPERVPTRSMLESATSGLNLFSPERQSGVVYGESFDPAPPSNFDAIAQSTQNLPLPTFGQQTPYEGSSDTIMQPFADRGSKGRTGMVEKLDASGEPVMRGRYTLDNGQYDSAALLEDLIAAGIPLDVANEFAAQGVQANQIIAAGADIAKQYRESQLAIQGEVAGMALTAIETLGMSPEDAVNQATPGGDVIPADQLRQFRVMFHQKTPEEQVQILKEIERQASFLGEKTLIPAEGTLVDARGRVIQTGQPRDRTPPPARQGTFEEYYQRFWTKNREPTQAEYDALQRRYHELSRELPPEGVYDLGLASRFNTDGVPTDPDPSVAGAPTGGQAPDVVPDISMTEEEQRYLANLDGQVPDRATAVQPRLESPEGAPTGSVDQGDVEQRDPVFREFPDYETGRQAAKDLLLTDPYQDGTVREAVARWTGGPGAAPDEYMNEMLESVGASVGDRPTPQREKMMSEVTNEELDRFLDVQQKWEGWYPGDMHGPPVGAIDPSRSFRLNNPGNIKRTDNRASALGDLPSESSLLDDLPFESPFESGLQYAQTQADLERGGGPGLGTSAIRRRPPADIPDEGYAEFGSPDLEVSDGIELQFVKDETGRLYDDDERKNPIDPSTLESLGVDNSGVYRIQTYPPAQVDNLGNIIENSFGRVFANLTTDQKAEYIDAMNALKRQGAGANQHKELLYGAAILGEDVTTKNQLRGRYATVRALQDTLELLNDMESAGIPPGFMRGSLEDIYRSIGRTTNTAYPMLKSRIGAMVIQYRRAATGVQFGIQEKKDYEELMPGYNSNMQVNRGAIRGLIRSMNVHNRAFWENAIGRTNAPVMFPELYPWVPNKDDFELDAIRTGPDGVDWYRPENPDEDLIEMPSQGKEGWTDEFLSWLPWGR